YVQLCRSALNNNRKETSKLAASRFFSRLLEQKSRAFCRVNQKLYRSWLLSRTPRRRPTRVALHAGPIPHQRKVTAFAAHLALVALGFGLGAAFGLAGGCCVGAGLAPLQGFELLGRREVVLRLLFQRDCAL